MMARNNIAQAINHHGYRHGGPDARRKQRQMEFRKNEPALREDEQASAEVATITDRKLLEQFAEMAVMIPAEPGGGTEDILKQVLSAKTWDELDKPWQTSDVKDIIGKHLRLMSANRRPSTFEDGLGQFLIVKLLDPKTGKDYVKTTSSVAVVGAIAWLYFNNASAVLLEWCQATRPTEKGYYPQHIKVIDAHVPGKGDGQ